jgi:glycosyltransferase involved in cell wall biosynthesis
VLRLIAELGLSQLVSAPGFVSGEQVSRELATAACLALPSSREGYGLVVIEAAAVGTPSVVIRDPDNAAVELVEHEVNGVICEQATPEALAQGIGAVLGSGQRMSASTAAWFHRHVDDLSIERSLRQVLGVYSSSARR